MTPRALTLAALPLALAIAACGPSDPPPMPEIALAPETPRTADDLVVTVTSQGEDITYAYAWTRDGLLVEDETGATLPAARTAKGQTWEVRVTPTRNRVVGFPNTANVTIRNTPPTVALAWEADEVSSRDDIVVNATTADVDDDDVRITYTWTVDGEPSAVSTNTVSWTRTSREQVWAVTATPNDGEEVGEPTTLTITVKNSAPFLDSVVVTPTPALRYDTLVATPDGLTDRDEDPITLTFDWYVGDSLVQSGPSDTLTGGAFVKGDTIRVVVTPNDGLDDGDPVSSADIPVVNAAPDLPPPPVITPRSPKDEDPLTCTAEPGIDIDEDPITYRFTWYKGDAVHATTTETSRSTVLSAASTRLGEVWSCDVVVIDDEGAESEVSERSEAVTVRPPRDGQVRKVDGTWIDADFERCGSGTSGCNATVARKACTDIGKKVASHASNGTSSVYNLGATNSCNFSISYYQLDVDLGSGACLVGVSNLDWSGCCGTSSWHGNTVAFGRVGSTFGFVNASNSGYSSSYPNVSGRTWGCQSVSTNATTNSGCTQHYVACVDG
jgi:hypothetical protein